MMMMMMTVMMVMMCKRLTQVPMLCVPIYNMTLGMMQKKTPIFTTFSAHTKMAADKRGQNEVFARNITILFMYIYIIYIYRRFYYRDIPECLINHKSEQHVVPNTEVLHQSS